MKWKIDLSMFGKINKAVATVMELKKYLALYESCKTLLPLVLEVRRAATIPCINLLIEFRKKVAEAEAVAAASENKIDDQISAVIAKAADKLLEFFHADDDYKKLSALDKATAPK